MLFLKHLHKFHLDLCSPIYSNSPQVSCLGMNPGRGWNSNLEGSYLVDYSKSEAEFWTQCHQDFIFYLCKFKVLILLQSQDIVNVPKLINFSILGFFWPGVKLGFEFTRVITNQKYQPRSLKFDFYGDINPMPGSLKIPLL